MATIDGIGLAEPSTITKSLAAVLIPRNSSNTYQEVMVIGDPDSTTSSAIAKVTNAAAASTAWGVVTRPVMPLTVAQSTAGDLRATVYQSTFTDLNVRVNAPSTANSSNYIPVRITDGSSYITPGNEYTDGSTYSSFAGPTISYDNSSNNTFRTVGLAQPLPVQLRTAAGVAVSASTTTLSTGSAVGLDVRPVQPSGRQSTSLLVTSSNSTVLYALTSSAAGLKQKAYAFSVTSTVTGPSTVLFCSVGSSDNTTIERWGVVLGSGSSGITGANLAVTPPAFLFESVTADAIKIKIENGASTQTIARVSLAWFSEA